MQIERKIETRPQPVQEAVAYLKGQRILCRLMEGFKEKYLSYGRFTGTVIFGKLPEEDLEILEGFLQTGFRGKKQIRVTAGGFQKALDHSRFAPAQAEDILQVFFGETLLGKKEQQKLRERRQEAVFNLTEQFWKGTVAEAWIRDVQLNRKRWNRFLTNPNLVPVGFEKESVSRIGIPSDSQESASRNAGRFVSKLEASLEAWKAGFDGLDYDSEEPFTTGSVLVFGAVMIENLPCKEESFEYLPVYAAKIAGNPHLFDNGTPAGSFLYELIRWMNDYEGKDMALPHLFSSFRRQREYLSTGIIQGDSSNFAMLYGVRAVRKDGHIHQGMDGFARECDMVQVPLHVIEEWNRLYCPDGRILIVENPSVYSILCHASGGRYACMCMNGQPKLSSLRVMDLLAISGVTVYYAGDFDPEGLLIAQKLKQYYTGSFYYWHMSEEDCESALSDIRLSVQRQKKLEKITDPELMPATEMIRKSGRAGYQEIIWERYLVLQEEPDRQEQKEVL